MDNGSEGETEGGRGWEEGETGGEETGGHVDDGESVGDDSRRGRESLVMGVERKWVGRGAGSRRKE